MTKLRNETFTEKLFFCTARVTAHIQQKETTATAFMYSVPISDTDSHIFLVSNKHVLEGADRLLVDVMASDGSAPVLGQGVTIEIRPKHAAHARFFASHADPAVDVSVINFGAFLNMSEAAGRPAHLGHIPSLMALNSSHIDLVSALEDITFIGYPAGVFDSVSLLPVVRGGRTASPLEVDYEGKPAFLVDAAVFPGSSGSPVLLLDRGMYQDRQGVTVVGSRFILLGVMAAVHTQQISGEVLRLPASTLVRIKQPIGLGLVFKASAIDETVDVVLHRLGLMRFVPE